MKQSKGNGNVIDIRMKSPSYPRMPEELMELANFYGLDSQYDIKRDAVAEKLGWDIAKVDRAIKQLIEMVDIPKANDSEAKKPKAEPEALPDDLVKLLKELPLWPEPVGTAYILDQIIGELKKYIILPEGAYTLIAVWILHTYVYDAFDVSPYLMLTSPEMRCGKTTVMRFLKKTCYRALPAANISPAVIYRMIKICGGTFLFDEADTKVKHNEETNNILNAGHEKEMAWVMRTNKANDSFTPEIFPCFCPKAIACIGKMARTLVDRSIKISMQRKAPGQKIERMRKFNGNEIKRKAARWAQDNFDKLKDAEPDMPENLDDRAQDNWEPLVAICDLAQDSRWPTEIRMAASLLLDVEPDVSLNTELLADVRKIIDDLQIDRISLADVTKELSKLEDTPWAEWSERGRPAKPIGKRRVSDMLGGFQVHPKTIRLDSIKTAKGYLRKDLEIAFARYLSEPIDPICPLNPDFLVTRSRSSNDAGFSGIFDSNKPPLLPSEIGPKALLGNDCDHVTEKGAEIRHKAKSDAIKALAPWCEGHDITPDQILESYPPEDYEALATDPRLAQGVVKSITDRLEAQGEDDERF